MNSGGHGQRACARLDAHWTMPVHACALCNCARLLGAAGGSERDAMLMARATLAVCTLSRSSRYIGTNILYSCIYEADLGVNIAFTAASHPRTELSESCLHLFSVCGSCVRLRVKVLSRECWQICHVVRRHRSEGRPRSPAARLSFHERDTIAVATATTVRRQAPTDGLIGRSAATLKPNSS